VAAVPTVAGVGSVVAGVVGASAEMRLKVVAAITARDTSAPLSVRRGCLVGRCHIAAAAAAVLLLVLASTVVRVGLFRSVAVIAAAAADVLPPCCRLTPESMAALPPFGAVEGHKSHKWLFQISSQ
jgi:hypothetical protein